MKFEARWSRMRYYCARLLGPRPAISICAAILCSVPTIARAQTVTFDKVVLSASDSDAHVFSSASGGTIVSLRLVVRDATTFAKIWEQLDSDLRKSVAPPPVDFATHDVIVVSLGASGVLGPFVVIDTVGVRAKRRIVILHRFVRSSHCQLEAGGYYDSRPTDIVVIPRDSVDATDFVVRVSALPYCGGTPAPGTPKPPRRP